MSISEINYDIQFEPIFSNFTFKGIEILSFKTSPSKKCENDFDYSSDNFIELYKLLRGRLKKAV